jgi:hypothetical protein
MADDDDILASFDDLALANSGQADDEDEALGSVISDLRVPKKTADEQKAIKTTEKVEKPITLGKSLINTIYNTKRGLELKYAKTQSNFERYEDIYNDNGLGENTSEISVDDQGNHHTMVVNVIQTVVEQKRAMIGVIPSVQCPPLDYGDESIRKAALREKAIMSIWSDCKIGQLMGDLGYYLSIFGTAVGVVYSDMMRMRPRMSIRSPKGFYCIPKDDSGIELAVAIFVSKYWGAHAAAMFPGNGFEKMTEVEVVEYWDKDVHAILAEDGKKVISAHENALKMVPVVSIPNIGRPRSPYGIGDVARLIGLQREVDRRVSLEKDIMQKVLDAPFVVVNPDQAPEEITLDPGSVIPVGEGGDVRQLNAFNIPYSWETSFGRLMNLFDRQADAPEVLRGTLDSAIVSGKGVDSLLGPVSGRIELRHHYIFPRIEWMNYISLMMWEKFWPDEQSSLDGTVAAFIKPSQFVTTFSPTELGGDYRNRVYMNSYAYLDQNAQVVLGLQLVQNQIISKETLRGELGVVVDPQQEKEQIKKESIEAVQLAMAAQQIANSPTTNNPPLGDQGKTNYGLERGFVGELNPAPAPGGPEIPENAGTGPEAPEITPEELAGGAMGGGAPQAGGNQLLTMVANFFRGIKKVKGRVFLVGAILNDPENIDYTGLEVYLTDTRDKQTILNAVRNNIPELHGNVQFYTGVPKGEYLEVTPGTEGYDVTGGSPANEEQPAMETQAGPPTALPPQMQPGGM